jgi:hypothetical protein
MRVAKESSSPHLLAARPRCWSSFCNLQRNIIASALSRPYFRPFIPCFCSAGRGWDSRCCDRGKGQLKENPFLLAPRCAVRSQRFDTCCYTVANCIQPYLSRMCSLSRDVSASSHVSAGAPPYEGLNATVEGISDEVLANTTHLRRKQWTMQVLLQRTKTCHLHH